jgi:hypothetical protein
MMNGKYSNKAKEGIGVVVIRFELMLNLSNSTILLYLANNETLSTGLILH